MIKNLNVENVDRYFFEYLSVFSFAERDENPLSRVIHINISRIRLDIETTILDTKSYTQFETIFDFTPKIFRKIVRWSSDERHERHCFSLDAITGTAITLRLNPDDIDAESGIT